MVVSVDGPCTLKVSHAFINCNQSLFFLKICADEHIAALIIYIKISVFIPMDIKAKEKLFAALNEALPG